MSEPFRGRALAGWALAAGLLGCVGCLSPHANPVEAVNPELAEECQKQPAAQRDHVYIFLINGSDPFQCANLAGVRDYFDHLGYCQSYYGQLCHVSRFAQKIRRIHQEDPRARFVLIGFSLGGPAVYDLARDAQAEGIPVDLVVFLSGKGITPREGDLDPSIRTVNVAACTLAWHDFYKHPSNRLDLSSMGHFQVVRDPRTVDMLARELALVASHVPVEMKETAGTPEPTLVDALKPVAHLESGRFAVDFQAPAQSDAEE